MALVVSSEGQKAKLEDIKPGNSVQIVWDGRTTTYMITKTDKDFANGKVPLVNLETGRLVFKPKSLSCVKVSATVTIEPFNTGNI